MEKTIEIPFGAKDSELKGWEYTIPENMEAEIKDGKIIVREKESEDEKIRKQLIGFLSGRYALCNINTKDAIAYLERQKEQRSEINIEHLKSYMLQYLQDAASKKEDSEIEADTDKWAKMIIKAFEGIEQKPASGNSEKPNNHAEWSEEDDALLKEIVSFFRDGTVKLQHDLDLYAGFLENKLKSLRTQPHWKPSEVQPEVELEKFADKIKTFQGRYKHPEIVSIKGAMAFMARMFYQYPNVARQWYDSLPKATMD